MLIRCHVSCHFQGPGLFTDIRKQMVLIKSIIEGFEEDNGGNRQISNQYSQHHAIAKEVERIYEKNADHVDR